MAEINAHEPLMTFARRYISERANVAQALHELEQHPEILDRVVREVDQAINRFNQILQGGISQEDEELLVNTREVMEVLRGRLPEVSQVEKEGGFGDIRQGVTVFKQVSELMRRGEAQEPEPRWSFHQQIPQADRLAAALILEGYGKYSEVRFPDTRKLSQGGFTVMLALEEIIALDHIRSGQFPFLFDVVREWYEPSEGFSSQLVQFVKESINQ